MRILCCLLCAANAFQTSPPRAKRVVLRAEQKSSGGLRLLEWLPSQKALVSVAKFGWRTAWGIMMAELAPQSPEGAYVRPAPQKGSVNAPKLKEDRDYVLYVGNACPWCHRTTIVRALRECQAMVKVVIMDDDPTKARRGGWSFTDAAPDPIWAAQDLKGVYDELGLEGRCTAPLLVGSDGAFVSNESGDIVRALIEYKGSRANDADLRPAGLAADIDAWNDCIYERVNNGVYRAGFATKQGPYEAAVRDVFDELRRLDGVLATSDYVAGDRVTEADVRLLPTVERFDAFYAPLFLRTATSVRHDFPHVFEWSRRMRAMPGVAETVDARAAAQSYYTSLFPLNPSGIVPVPPGGSSTTGEVAEEKTPEGSSTTGGVAEEKTTAPAPAERLAARLARVPPPG